MGRRVTPLQPQATTAASAGVDLDDDHTDHQGVVLDDNDTDRQGIVPDDDPIGCDQIASNDCMSTITLVRPRHEQLWLGGQRKWGSRVVAWMGSSSDESRSHDLIMCHDITIASPLGRKFR